VAAKTDCTALFLDKRTLQRKLGEDIGFASRFYHALAILLSDRLRATEKRMMYGRDRSLEDESVRLKDELDIGVLDQVSMAGDRFERLLKRVEGEA
jgi:CRP/FNR family transcriptional regulator, cyclic AMP receptor protein